MYNSTINAYSKIHERIKEALFDNGKLEGNRLEHLRCLRNTAHGPFLRREQFERAFFSSAATIPPEVIFLPLLLTWGLILETEKFLEL